jgi:acetolactate synthase small subunit
MSITAAYALVGSNDGTAQMSGTSMAAPFVAGAYLQALSLYPQMTSSQAMSLLRCVATKGIMRGDMISVNADTPNVMVRFGEVFASTQNVLAVVNQTFMVAMESMAAVFVEMQKRDKYVEELREQLKAAHARIVDLEKAEIEIEVLRDDNGRLEWLIEVLKKDLRKSEESGIVP